jgi:hypothetical protein
MLISAGAHFRILQRYIPPVLDPAYPRAGIAVVRANIPSMGVVGTTDIIGL